MLKKIINFVTNSNHMLPMNKNILQLACVLGALSVGLGAFAAHGLKSILSAENIQIFETGVKYQFYHVFALLAAAILYKYFNRKWITIAANLFLVGMLIFSGSLYLLCFSKQFGWGVNWLGAITPIGGLCFILGWVFMFLGIKRR
jgi:uncharacterized membrane protein YgdD (TMEM256/DUF423 family)